MNKILIKAVIVIALVAVMGMVSPLYAGVTVVDFGFEPTEEPDRFYDIKLVGVQKSTDTTEGLIAESNRHISIHIDATGTLPTGHATVTSKGKFTGSTPVEFQQVEIQHATMRGIDLAIVVTNIPPGFLPFEDGFELLIFEFNAGQVTHQSKSKELERHLNESGPVNLGQVGVAFIERPDGTLEVLGMSIESNPPFAGVPGINIETSIIESEVPSKTDINVIRFIETTP